MTKLFDKLYIKLLILVSIILTFLLRIDFHSNLFDFLFWDSLVIYCGPLYYSTGENPYSLLNECSSRVGIFKYVYLPFFLELFSSFIKISIESFFIIWVIIIFLSIIITANLLNKIFQIKNYLFTFLIMLFSLSGIPFYGFLSGNISIILYMLAAYSIYLTMSEDKKKTLLGIVIIFLISLFKIHLLILFIIPMTYISLSYFKYIITLSTFVPLFVLYNGLAYPVLFKSFLLNLGILPFAGDMGVGLMKFSNFINSRILGLSDSYHTGTHNWKVIYEGQFNLFYDYILSLLFIIIYLFSALKIRKSSFSVLPDEDKRIKISLAIIIATLCMPRLKQYDLLLTGISCLYLINSKILQDLAIEKFKKMNKKILIIFLNLMVLGFFSIKGDNYFIYPICLIIITIFLVLFFSLKKKNA